MTQKHIAAFMALLVLVSCNEGTPEKAEDYFQSNFKVDLHYDKLVTIPADSIVSDIDKDGNFDLVYFVQQESKLFRGTFNGHEKIWYLDRLCVTYSEGTSLATYLTNVYSMRSAEATNKQTIKVIIEAERCVLIVTDEHGVRYYQGNFHREKPFLPMTFQSSTEVKIK